MSTDMPHVAIMEAACQRGEIPGAVLVAADATGKFQYSRAFGQTARGEKLEVDSTMWLASSTKLMTAVAALQQVQRGLIGLDDDVSSVLPEAVAQGVLEGWDSDGQPIIKEREGVITLRLFLSNASGHAHPLYDPAMKTYVDWKGGSSDPRKPLVKELAVPLTRQPGRGWVYGCGYDWAGKLVERLSGVSLEEYMRANIWEPLGMKRVSFRPSHPDIQSRKVGMSILNDEGKLVPFTEKYDYQYGEVADAYGGGGCWGSAESFLVLLQSLCANDGKVLSTGLTDEMFHPQLGAESKAELNSATRSGTAFSVLFEGSWTAAKQDFDHGLGGLLGLRDEPGRRKAGTMTWCGAPNLWWFIDRKGGLCGAYFCQLFPIGSPRTIELEKVFEADIYKKYTEFFGNN